MKKALEEECDEESLQVLPKAVDTVRKRVNYFRWKWTFVFNFLIRNCLNWFKSKWPKWKKLFWRFNMLVSLYMFLLILIFCFDYALHFLIFPFVDNSHFYRFAWWKLLPKYTVLVFSLNCKIIANYIHDFKAGWQLLQFWNPKTCYL